MAKKSAAEKNIAAAVSENKFECNGKKYQVVMHAVNIPGMGHRTALEICADEEAQKYLVENCVGSVIEEIA